MDIYTTLTNDHRVVADLLRRIERSGRFATSERAELFASVRNELLSHSHAEDRVFYSTLRGAGLETLIDQAERDHALVEALLQQVEAIAVLDAEWLTRFRDLAAAVERHVTIEEGEIFPAARRVLDVVQAEALGTRMLQEKAHDAGAAVIEQQKGAYRVTATR